jgi:hypothetical protein
MEEQILAEAHAEFGQVGPSAAAPAATSAAEPTAAPSTGPTTGHTSTGSTAATEGDHDRA